MRRLKFRRWVKVTFAILIFVIVSFGFIKLMDARLRYACKYQGYTAICPVESDGE